mmetsp:Transcript_59305/g.130249  ORF Transcript_59305/g.130249 Transcript_59305/m.130249 type:complete len:211 (+) Transcript_59305:533-1165(+)
MEWLVGLLTLALLARAEASKVLHRARRYVAVEAEHNSPHVGAIDLDVQEGLVCDIVPQGRPLLLTLEEESLAHGIEAVVGIPILFLRQLFQPRHSTTLTELAVIDDKVRCLDIHFVEDLIVDDEATFLGHHAKLERKVAAFEDHVLGGHVVSDRHVDLDRLSVLRQRPIVARSVDWVPVKRQVAPEWPKLDPAAVPRPADLEPTPAPHRC